MDKWPSIDDAAAQEAERRSRRAQFTAAALAGLIASDRYSEGITLNGIAMKTDQAAAQIGNSTLVELEKLEAILHGQ